MSSKPSEIPQIVIEPSTTVQNPSSTAVSVQESAFTYRNGFTEGTKSSPSIETCSSPELDAASIAPSEEIPPLEPKVERQKEDEFSPAESCNDCTVPVQESRSETETRDTTTPESSESDPDEFRTYRCCRSSFFTCKETYLRICSALTSRYAIPVWLILMALPLSAGIMGATYMFNCPACVALPNNMFMMGISMMALLTFHVCIIVHKVTSENENFRSMLRTLKLICMFITVLFYLVESVSYWRMESNTEEGTPKYCHPTFISYAFWWNIATSVLLGVIVLFPID